MSIEAIVHIDGDNWKTEVLESPIPVLVDFWAEWCGPCRALAPVLDDLAVEYGDQLKIVKVDVDKHAQLAGEFGIRSIPTLLVFKAGAVQEQMVGALQKSALKSKIDAHL